LFCLIYLIKQKYKKNITLSKLKEITLAIVKIKQSQNKYFCMDKSRNLETILTKQHNFRDLGGIVAMDGRVIRHGLLFRSGDFYLLSDHDISALVQLNLRTIIDLRARREMVNRPDKIIPTVRETIHIDIHDAAREKAALFLENNDARGLETILIADYIRMIDKHVGDFSLFLHLIATTENLPLVYHCAAGKDRTGMATVFLLTALGVEMQKIRDDYMATNEYTKAAAEKIIRNITESGLNGEILRPLLEVREEYLEAALTEIDQKYNSLNCFVADVLKADVKGLQERYLMHE